MNLQAQCPECGALVPLLRERWLRVHNVESPTYTFPGPDRPRCPGSFILATRSRVVRRSEDVEQQPVPR